MSDASYATWQMHNRITIAVLDRALASGAAATNTAEGAGVLEHLAAIHNGRVQWLRRLDPDGGMERVDPCAAYAGDVLRDALVASAVAVEAACRRGSVSFAQTLEWMAAMEAHRRAQAERVVHGAPGAEVASA